MCTNTHSIGELSFCIRKHKEKLQSNAFPFDTINTILISLHFPNQTLNKITPTLILSLHSVFLCMPLKWGISAPHSRRRNHRRPPSPTPLHSPFPATDGLECVLHGETTPETP